MKICCVLIKNNKWRVTVLLFFTNCMEKILSASSIKCRCQKSKSLISAQVGSLDHYCNWIIKFNCLITREGGRMEGRHIFKKGRNKTLWETIHLRERNFKHSIQDTLNPLCSCRKGNWNCFSFSLFMSQLLWRKIEPHEQSQK